MPFFDTRPTRVTKPTWEYILSVVVQPLVQNGTFGSGIFRNVKMSAPNIASGTEPARMTKGIAKTVELGREHEEDEDHGQPERLEKLVPLGAELARLTRVIDHVALGQDLGGFIFQKAQGLIKRAHGYAADRDGVELLKTVQRARHGGVSDRGDRAEGHELSVRSGNVNIFQLVRVEAVHAFDLWDDLVAAAGDIEAIDKIAAQHGCQIGADLLQIETQVGHLVAVDDESPTGADRS